MASNRRSITVSTSPKSGAGDAANSPKGPWNSPKGQCVCSPTTHQGSFRCRIHRSSGSTTTPLLNRSKSIPNSNSHASSLSPKSVDST